MTTRDHLLLAFAKMNRYSIAAVGAIEGTEESIRRRLSEVLAGWDSEDYAFWTAADDVTCFTSAGALVRPLPIHYGGESVPEAVRAVFDDHGLWRPASQGPGTLLLEMASAAAAASGAR